MLRIDRRQAIIDIELSPDLVVAESALQVLAHFLIEQGDSDPIPLLQVMGVLIRIAPSVGDSQPRMRIRCKRLKQGFYRIDVDVPGRDLRPLLLEDETISRWCPRIEIGWRPSRFALEVAIPSLESASEDLATGAESSTRCPGEAAD